MPYYFSKPSGLVVLKLFCTFYNNVSSIFFQTSTWSGIFSCCSLQHVLVFFDPLTILAQGLVCNRKHLGYHPYVNLYFTWWFTSALSTEICIHIRSTTIFTIKLTFSIVKSIVTVAISNHWIGNAIARSSIKASTSRAELFDYTWSTTISSIIVTLGYIIVIIAVAISNFLGIITG